MHKKYMENNLYYSITSTLLLLSFYAYQYLFNWPLLKISGILGSSRFIDLVAIQDFSRCVNEYGMAVYEISDKCSGYQYSLGVLYLFDYTKFSSLSSNAAAFLLEIPLLFIMISLITLSFNKNIKIGVFAVVAALAPGNWLLLERGNLDLIMVELLAIAALTFGKKSEPLGYLMLVISVFTKFYTAPLLILYVIMGKRTIRKNLYLPVTIVVVLASLVQIKNVAKFPSTWYVSFGSGSIGHWANLFLEYQVDSNNRIPEKVGLVIGLLIACISIAIHWKALKNFEVSQANFVSTKANVILFFGTTFIACYFVGMNYDYRMIFPIVTSTLLLIVEKNLPYRKYFVSIAIGSFYFSSFFYGQSGMMVVYQQLIGDIFIGLLVSYLCVYFLRKYRSPIMEIVSKCKNLLLK
ncbi:hypothetical protein MCEMRE196_00041 [Candidatus Nanopelagicaceae bacterium]